MPADLPERRHPSSVTDAEVADVALDLAARLMGDLKDGVRPGAGSGHGRATAGDTSSFMTLGTPDAHRMLHRARHLNLRVL